MCDTTATTAKLPVEGADFVQYVSVNVPVFQTKPVVVVKGTDVLPDLGKESVEPLLESELFKAYHFTVAEISSKLYNTIEHSLCKEGKGDSELSLKDNVGKGPFEDISTLYNHGCRSFLPYDGQREIDGVFGPGFSSFYTGAGGSQTSLGVDSPTATPIAHVLISTKDARSTFVQEPTREDGKSRNRYANCFLLRQFQTITCPASSASLPFPLTATPAHHATPVNHATPATPAIAVACKLSFDSLLLFSVYKAFGKGCTRTVTKIRGIISATLFLSEALMAAIYMWPYGQTACDGRKKMKWLICRKIHLMRTHTPSPGLRHSGSRS